MLQIASGKLFTREAVRRNELRGILYSNFVLHGDRKIETAAGRLLGIDALRTSQAIVYECLELIEGSEQGPGVLISHGIDPYLDDFAVVVSFALLVTCTPDAELASRLTSGKRGLSVRAAPDKLVKRAFDAQVWCQDDDAKHLVTFVRALIGLPREKFLGVMRAIRSYVTAMHRLIDDADLSYTLFVASLESMAQDFDGHRAEWEDFEERKREAIDVALQGSSQDIADKVRAALLGIEHVSLGRRFRDFVLAHVEPAFFRSEAASQENPIGRSELPDALRQAYGLRSRYVHNLEALPKLLTLGHTYSETSRDGRDTILTFQGLSRLARHVITTFVFRQPFVSAEPYNYHFEQSGIIQVGLHPSCWIGYTEGLTEMHGRDRLEGFLEELVPVLDDVPSVSLTDLRPLLDVVQPMLPTMPSDKRRPFLALYFLFNWIAPKSYRAPNLDAIWQKYNGELQSPSVESLLVHLVQQQIPEWSLGKHRAVHDAYFRRRDRGNGLRVARSLEMRLTLMLAERYRADGDQNEARNLVSLAVENRPGFALLRELETNFQLDQPIDWRDELTKRACYSHPPDKS